MSNLDSCTMYLYRLCRLFRNQFATAQVEMDRKDEFLLVQFNQNWLMAWIEFEHGDWTLKIETDSLESPLSQFAWKVMTSKPF